MELVVFACGDSFTAGDELADDMFYPDSGLGNLTHQEWIDPESQKSNTLRIQAIHQHKNNHKLTAEQKYNLEAENLRRAYPAKLYTKLSEKLNGQCVLHNYAAGGAGQEWINREIIDKYLHETKHGRTQGRKVIFLVGITYVNRIQYFSTSKSVNYWSSIMLHITDSITPQINDIRKTAIMHEHEDARLHKWLLCNLLLKTFCQSKGIDLYFVRSVFGPENLVNPIAIGEKQSFIGQSIVSLFDELDINYIINLEDIAKEQDENAHIVKPGGHFVEYIHDMAADKIFNEFVAKYSL